MLCLVAPLPFRKSQGVALTSATQQTTRVCAGIFECSSGVFDSHAHNASRPCVSNLPEQLTPEHQRLAYDLSIGVHHDLLGLLNVIEVL